MKNKLTNVMVLLTVLSLAAAGPLAYAAPEEGGQKKGPGYERGEGPKFFQKLNLTPEQKEKLKAQRESRKEAVKAVHKELKTKMQALHEEIAKPVTDRAKINGQVAEVNTLKGQIFAQHIEGILGMKEILTPEQFAQLQADRKDRRSGKHGGWGKHHKEGPGEGFGGAPGEGPEKE